MTTQLLVTSDMRHRFVGWLSVCLLSSSYVMPPCVHAELDQYAEAAVTNRFNSMKSDPSALLRFMDDASLVNTEDKFDNSDDVTCRDVSLTATCRICNVMSVGMRNCCKSGEVYKICHSAVQKRRTYLRKKSRNPFLGKRSQELGMTSGNEEDETIDDLEDLHDDLVFSEDKRGKIVLFGKRGKNPFLGKRGKNPFLGKRAKNPFLGKRAKNPFLGKRAKNPFLGKKSARNPFLGKRKNPFFGKRGDGWLNNFWDKNQLGGLDEYVEPEVEYDSDASEVKEFQHNMDMSEDRD